jgi:hypothetical protein
MITLVTLAGTILVGRGEAEATHRRRASPPE